MVLEVFATTIITNYHAAVAAAAVAQQLKLGVSIENKNETHRLTKPSRQFEIKLHFFRYICVPLLCAVVAAVASFNITYYMQSIYRYRNKL